MASTASTLCSLSDIYDPILGMSLTCPKIYLLLREYIFNSKENVTHAMMNLKVRVKSSD